MARNLNSKERKVDAMSFETLALPQDAPKIHEVSAVALAEKKPKGSAANNDSDIYDLFYREVSKVPLLTAEAELSLIESIHKREHWFWFQLLGLKSLVKAMVEEGSLPNNFRKNKKLEQFVKVRNLALHHGLRAELAAALRRSDVCLALAQGLFSQFKNSPSLPSGELDTCAAELKRLRDRFTRSNLRLVASVAKRFNNRKVGFMDKIQEGSMGLLIGLQSFDTERGLRFSTYGHWWIRQSIERCIQNQGATIRIPVHVHDHLRAYKKCEAQLNSQLGRKPSMAEMIASLGLSPRKVRQLELGVPQAYLETKSEDGASSLDQHQAGDAVAGACKPEQVLADKVNAHELMRGLSSLKPIERELLGVSGSSGRKSRPSKPLAIRCNSRGSAFVRFNWRPSEKSAPISKTKAGPPPFNLRQLFGTVHSLYLVNSRTELTP